jgi:diguanylate cyclase (GGDEF)-like protein
VEVRLIARGKVWIFVWSVVFLNAILAFTLGHSRSLTAIGDTSQCLLLLVALSYLLRITKEADQRGRLFWGLFSLGCGLWLIVQILWTCFEVLLGREVPNPFVGDVALFLHLVPMMAAMAVRPDRERSEAASQVGSFDFTLLLTWWLYLYLFVVIPWQYVLPNELLYGRSFDALYLLEHFVFLACMSAVWLQSNGNWKRIYGHLLGASALYAASSIAASFAIDLHTYYTGSVYDIPLLGAMAWFAGMAQLARKLSSHSGTGKAVHAKPVGWVSALAMLAILSLPLMAGWALYTSQTPSAVRDFRVVLTLITIMAMGTLTWIKQHRLDRQLARAYQDLREDSLTDLLTGARNRRFFATTIDGDTKQAIRAYSAPGTTQPKRNQDLAFYVIDADSFKEVNDRYGHDAGDELLVQIAQRISSAIRYSDVLIRWGGDEFLVLSRYTDRDDSVSLASRVLTALADEPFQLTCGTSVRSTCSIGWAVFPWFVRQPEAIPYEEILRLADSALYEAKKVGRNRAIGMLPTSQEPDVKTATPGSKKARLTEQLGARMITIEGAITSGEKKSPTVKALAATQGS